VTRRARPNTVEVRSLCAFTWMGAAVPAGRTLRVPQPVLSALVRAGRVELVEGNKPARPSG